MSDEKHKIRQDIQTYETQKKIKRLAQLGTLAGLSGMGYGGATRNKMLLGLSTAGTLGLAFGAGRAKQRRDMALGRIKRHYDLRDDKLFNMRAVLPSADDFKKHAVVGGLMEAVTYLAGIPAEHWLPMLGVSTGVASGIAHLAPSIIDAAATPGLAKMMTNRGFDFAKVFAKQHLGKPQSATELKMVGKAFKAKGAIARAAANKLPVLGPVDRYFTNFLAGPAGIGSAVGEPIGVVLKHVGEISPRYQEMGLNAINSEPARKMLVDVATQDLADLGKALDKAKTSRVYKLFSRVSKGGAPSAKNILSKLVDDQGFAEHLVDTGLEAENKAVRGIKAMGVGAGAAVLANAAGQMRTRHPLSKDELPKKLVTKTA